jgi:hypothetical protein
MQTIVYKKFHFIDLCLSVVLLIFNINAAIKKRRIFNVSADIEKDKRPYAKTEEWIGETEKGQAE